MFGSGIMHALPPGTMQPPVDTAASKPVCRGSRPVHVGKTCAQVPRAKRALPGSTFANPWAEVARSGETAAQHGIIPPCHKDSTSESDPLGRCAGVQNLTDSIQATQLTMLDAAQRVQRGMQPRPPGFPPGTARPICTQAVPLS